MSIWSVGIPIIGGTVREASKKVALILGGVGGTVVYNKRKAIAKKVKSMWEDEKPKRNRSKKKTAKKASNGAIQKKPAKKKAA